MLVYKECAAIVNVVAFSLSLQSHSSDPDTLLATLCVSSMAPPPFQIPPVNEEVNVVPGSETGSGSTSPRSMILASVFGCER